jgi:hypothetical protein
VGSKRKKKGAPAIVPRFLKGAVTIGAIPALAASCARPTRPPPPVVAYMAPPPEPQDAAEGPTRPPPPVVAAYKVQPVVAAYATDARPVAPSVPVDAGVDAPPATKTKKKARPDAALPPPPPVVAALVAPPPTVVAAYVPREVTPVPPKQKSPKKP